MYIGNEPVNGNFSVADAITTSSTATYALTVGSVAFTPESVNHCIVSLNGVVQAPTNAYTISGSNIVFASALTSSDVIDFIYFLGHVNDIGTVSDGTVSLAKMAVNSIDSDQYVDGSIDLAHMSSQSVDEDNLHISNAGTNGQYLQKQSGNSGGMTWADASGGFSEVDSWVLTSNLTGDADPIASNLARRSVTGWAAAKTGTGMTESSGIFTFPSTGQWLVSWQLQFYLNADSRYDNYIIQVTTNNSSYSDIGQAAGHVGRTHSGNTYLGVFGQTLIDVTDTANVKCRFKVAHHDATAVTVGNHNGASQFNFYRLADT